MGGNIVELNFLNAIFFALSLSILRKEKKNIHNMNMSDGDIDVVGVRHEPRKSLLMGGEHTHTHNERAQI